MNKPMSMKKSLLLALDALKGIPDPEGFPIPAWRIQVKDVLREIPYTVRATRDGRIELIKKADIEYRMTTPAEFEREEKKSEVKFLIDFFFSELKHKIGQQPVGFNGGAAARGFKDALNNYSSEEITSRINDWFKSDDPFIEKNTWSVTLFFKNFNALAQGPVTGGNRSGIQSGATAAFGKYSSLGQNQGPRPEGRGGIVDVPPSLAGLTPGSKGPG